MGSTEGEVNICTICKELIKLKLTLNEAKNNAEELLAYSKNDDEFNHYSDIIESVDNMDELLLDDTLHRGIIGEESNIRVY